MHPVKVKILNHEYLLKTEEDEEKVQQIAAYVSEKLGEVKENTEGLPERKIAILAALNIASEYFQLLKERNELVDNIRQRTKNLIFNIDSMIG